MIVWYEQLLGATVPALMAAAFLIPIMTLVTKCARLYHYYASAVAAFAALSTVLTYKYVVDNGTLVYFFGGWFPPVGIIYEVDQFSALLGAVTGVVMLAITVYSRWYLGDHEGVAWYYTMLLGLEAGMLGSLYTGDAFNLFVMLEVMSVSAYGLVAYHRRTKEAVEAALKYSLIGATATTIYFLALLFIYGSFGTLNMADIALRVSTNSGLPIGNFMPQNPGLVSLGASIALALSIWVFMVKSAVFPTHFWLPDAHPAAPSPVSAALSGLFVNVGLYAIARFIHTIFGGHSDIDATVQVLSYSLLILGGVSAIIASTAMITQYDIKRLIAYSTVMHTGLIASAIALGTPEGMYAATYHITTHAVGKALLFLSAGALVKVMGSRYLSDLSGAQKYAPIASAGAVVAAMSLIGLPPFGGFFSKLALYKAFADAGQVWMVAVILVSSAFALMAYMKLVHTMFFRLPKTEAPTRITASANAAMIALIVGVVVLGVLYPLINQYFISSGASALDRLGYISAAVRALTSYFGGGT